jgi:hypothetical protein
MSQPAVAALAPLPFELVYSAEADWARLFRRDGSLLPTEAEAERARAEAAEAELARLRALLDGRVQG